MAATFAKTVQNTQQRLISQPAVDSPVSTEVQHLYIASPLQLQGE